MRTAYSRPGTPATCIGRGRMIAGVPGPCPPPIAPPLARRPAPIRCISTGPCRRQVRCVSTRGSVGRFSMSVAELVQRRRREVQCPSDAGSPRPPDAAYASEDDGARERAREIR
eukprot:3548330-Rhodomonas_salina.1